MTPLDDARRRIASLVEKYNSLPAGSRHPNEAATCSGFIQPLFEALGWDFSNTDEVKPQELVSRGFADYAFRVGGVTRFYLEAKRLGDDLVNDEWANQAINYAWTKGVPWAVLTNFRALKVFNAEWQGDDPRQALFLTLTADEYLPQLDKLWWLSRDEVAHGALDREARIAWVNLAADRPVAWDRRRSLTRQTET